MEIEIVFFSSFYFLQFCLLFMFCVGNSVLINLSCEGNLNWRNWELVFVMLLRWSVEGCYFFTNLNWSTGIRIFKIEFKKKVCFSTWRPDIWLLSLIGYNHLSLLVLLFYSSVLLFVLFSFLWQFWSSLPPTTLIRL